MFCLLALTDSANSIRRRIATIKPVLDPDGSAALCDQQLTDLARLSSADDAATWAHRIMATKNSLAAVDARRVEDAFAAKMATLGSGHEYQPSECLTLTGIHKSAAT